MDANKTAGRAFLARPILAIDRYIGGSITNADKTIDCGSKTDTCEASFDKGTEVTLTAQADTGYAPAAWQGACDETATGQPCKLTMNANQTAGRVFLLDTDEDGDPDITDPDDDGDGTDDVTDVDDDNDGLIEVHNLDMFDHIQYSLAGTSYKTGASIADNRTGGPTEATADCTTVATGVYLCGYELTKDLDFAEGASYAMGGTFNGGDGNDSIGGLVGGADYDSSIVIASYAMGGTFNGGAGSDDVGGLIGRNQTSLVASYATGGTINGDAGSDGVGGLAGINTAIGGSGSVTASYATGVANGGAGDDYVGALVGHYVYGRLRSTVTASYAFGSKSGGVGGDHHDGTAKPDGVTSANGLTATNVDAKWNDAAEKTLNVWDFGTASQAPALRYADYDGDGGVDYCDMFPKKIPGTNIPLICGKSLLPGQRR